MIGGTSLVAKLCSIQLEIIDDSGERDKILLKNATYVPSFPKNLITISQWSKKREDDCGFFVEAHTRFSFGIMIKSKS